MDLGWQGKDKATAEEREEKGPFRQAAERKEEKRMPGKEGGSHDDSWAFGDRRFIFSPVCLLWSCHLQSCLGPLQAWSCQARQRQTRGKKKKKKRLAGGTGCRPLPGSEWGLLQGQLGLRAWGPLWSSLCSALFSQRCPGVEDGDPGRAQSSSGHPPGHGLPGTSLHEKVSHLHQNVN